MALAIYRLEGDCSIQRKIGSTLAVRRERAPPAQARRGEPGHTYHSVPDIA